MTNAESAIASGEHGGQQQRATLEATGVRPGLDG